MKNSILSFLTLLAICVLLEDPHSKSGKTSEIKDPHQMLNHLWLGKETSSQMERESIERSFDFQTQG